MKERTARDKKHFESSGYARLFLWAAKAKYTMGLFFSVYVILFLLLGLLVEGTAITLGFFTALEMMAACFSIGILQRLFLLPDKRSRVRSALWVICGTSITVLFGFAFQWFKGFAAWCFPAFSAAILIGMLFVLLSDYLELQNETQQLNRKLAQFQSGRESKGD